MGHYRDAVVSCSSDQIAKSSAYLSDFTKLRELIFTDTVTEVNASMIETNATLSRVVFMNPECKIAVKDSNKCTNLKEVYGYAGSPAEEFAKQFNIPFYTLKDGNLPDQLSYAPNDDVSNFTYTVNGSEITITSIRDRTPLIEEITIPETINGKPVTELAFSGVTAIPRTLRILNLPTARRIASACLGVMPTTLAFSPLTTTKSMPFSRR